MIARDPFLNRQIDEYRIDALLGRGGMGRVYLGYDIHLKRSIAIKVIDTPHRTDSAYVSRFEREAQVIAQLSHPNIRQLYRYGEKDGFLYMVMQFVDGSDLQTILASYRADGEFMEPHEAAGIIQDACQALDYVHKKGVIHRDIKPSNILLTREGQAILSDFGLALISREGTLGETFGSPQYIAPEQAISSAKAEPRSDFYSLGVILYEIFTGRLPFYAKDPLDLARMHIQETVPPPRSIRPEISPEIEAVILKSLSKAPEDRYADGTAFSNALDNAVRDQQPIPAVPGTLSHLTVPERVQIRTGTQPPSRSSDTPILALSEAKPAAPAMPEKQKPDIKKRTVNRALPFVLVAGVLGLLAVSFLSFGILSARARLNPLWQNSRVSLLAASQTPAATQPVASQFVIHLIKDGEDSLFLLNDSSLDLPLAPLQLGNPPGKINGADWKIEALKSGECIAVIKKGTKGSLPAGLNCAIIGQLERSGTSRIWMSTFNLYYQSNFIGECEQAQDECTIYFR